MAYLIEQLFGWLLIVAILCALAGWAYHALKNSVALERMIDERDKLQKNLIALVTQDLPTGDGPLTKEHGWQLDTLRAQLDVANARAEDLERHNRSLRDQHETDVALLADMRSAQANEQVITLPDAPAALVAPEGVTRPEQWRLRYFEARTKHLEALEAHPPQDMDAQARIGELEDLLQAARARGHDLEGQVAALNAQSLAPQDNPLTDENNRLSWHARYLEGRVQYLEQQAGVVAPQPVAAPVDPQAEEDERRSQWRMRYLEARVSHLDGLRGQADASTQASKALAEKIAGLEAALAEKDAGLADVRTQMTAAESASAQRLSELDALLTEAERERDQALARAERVAALEAEVASLAAVPKVPPESGRIRWRTRYLEARVAHLEASLGSLAANRPVPAPVPAPAPIAPPPPPPEPVQPAVVAPPRPVAPPPAPVVVRGPAPLAPFEAGGEVRPLGLAAPRDGAPDDLRLIEGVGPKLESTLHSLGVFHFDQIAAWTAANVAWVDQYLRFRGRIVRERWVEQAKELSADGAAIRVALEQEPI